MLVVRDRTTSGPSVEQTPIRSLAVLPFKNFSGASGDEFLSVGLADALVTHLQQIPDLRIRPTSAILAYKDQEASARAVGDELEVDGVLEGNFLTEGQKVRISLQLTDARTGYGVWAKTIDGERGNLIRLMDRVSGETTTALRRRLAESPATRRSEPRTSSPPAYEAYLRARSKMGSLRPEDFREQISALQRAIELDPQFAAAYADLGIALSLGQVRGLLREDQSEHPADWYARQAVRIDPNLAQAHLALGRTLIRQPDHFRESVRENLAALRIDPNLPEALATMASYFVATGDLQRAECIIDRLVALDPSSPDARTRGYWYVNAVDPDAAIQSAAAAMKSEQTQLAAHDIRALSFLVRGDLSSAEVETREASRIAPRHYSGRTLGGMIAAAQGDRDRAEKSIASVIPEARGNHWAALRVALTESRLGDQDAALRWLDRAARLGNHSWYFLVKHPWFAPLQDRPEFQDILARMRKDLDDVHDDVLGVYQLICGSGDSATSQPSISS